METQQKGRALYVVLALVFAGLIVGGATWFFKLMGPEAIVAGAKPAFLKLLQTVQPATPTP